VHCSCRTLCLFPRPRPSPPTSPLFPYTTLFRSQWADWAPDGSNLAVVRDLGGQNRLEYPIGKVLYQTAAWISHPQSDRGLSRWEDRKSTRLNSSHRTISYAVFCLKKKTNRKPQQ